MFNRSTGAATLPRLCKLASHVAAKMPAPIAPNSERNFIDLLLPNMRWKGDFGERFYGCLELPQTSTEIFQPPEPRPRSASLCDRAASLRSEFRRKLLVFPHWFALLNHSTQAFLHVFQAHQFVEIEVL